MKWVLVTLLSLCSSHAFGNQNRTKLTEQLDPAKSAVSTAPAEPAPPAESAEEADSEAPAEQVDPALPPVDQKKSRVDGRKLLVDALAKHGSFKTLVADAAVSTNAKLNLRQRVAFSFRRDPDGAFQALAQTNEPKWQRGNSHLVHGNRTSISALWRFDGNDFFTRRLPTSHADDYFLGILTPLRSLYRGALASLRFTYEGKQACDERRVCHVVKAVRKGFGKQDTFRFLLGSQNLLLYAFETQVGKRAAKVFLSNYKRIGGSWLPHTILIEKNTSNISLSLTRIQIDVPLDKQSFSVSTLARKR